MKNMLRNHLKLTVGALVLAASLPLYADTIYDNSAAASDLKIRFNPGTAEVGDEILLAGNARYLTSFAFEYWGTNTAAAGNPFFSSTVSARVKLYLNDGPAFNGYRTPGTVLYDSLAVVGSIPLIPTTRSVLSFVAGVDFPSSGIFLGLTSTPSLLVTNMTWSVTFSGQGATDQVGVDLYSPPVIGKGYPDYWRNLNDGSGWTLLTNSIGPMNFAAVLQAVPEPSSVLLGLLGGVGVLLGIRRFNGKQ